MHFFYLHGFASSPASGKARFYQEQLGKQGVALECLDLNLPDFATMTVTRMLDQLDEAIDRRTPGPVALIGSSLGGFAALHDAARRNAVRGQRRPVARLVLLAPALAFASNDRLDPLLDDWRRTGARTVFHYGYGRSMNVGYALWEDGRRYDSNGVELDIPILIFQGRRDEVVPPSTVAEFAECRPNVRLRMLDDDHQLQQHLPEMWRESAAFLGLDAG